MAVRQVVSGEWQDAQGNPLAGGKVVFEASGDAQLSSSAGEMSAGIKGSLTLDDTGSVAASPAQFMWPTDQMNPSNITYTVWVYTAEGQLAWGPNYGLTVPSGAGSFDLDTWVPNQIGSGSGPSGGSLVLQTNGVNNGSQQLLDLQQGSGITLVDNGSGQVTISGASANGPRSRAIHSWATAGNAGLAPSQGAGCLPSISGATFTAIAPTATDTNYLGIGTGASANTLVMWCDNTPSVVADDTFTLGIIGVVEKRIMLPSTANVRVWTGLQFGSNNGSNANFWKSDAPPLPTIAFRYSTAAGDVNWQCVVTDGSTVNSADSGFPVVANAGHVFGIQISGTNVLFFIDNAQVASVSMIGTTLTTASAFTGFLSIDNVGLANNKVVGLDYQYWDTIPA